MKRASLIVGILLLSTVVVSASSRRMNVDTSKISFDNSSKTISITSNFDSAYAIEYDDNELKGNTQFEETMTKLTKKTTYLLLGNSNSVVNNYTDYAKRKEELYNLRYAPDQIPKDENGNYITSSEEYKDDVVTGINIPGMFKLLSEKNITYENFGTVKVFETDEYVITRTALSGVTIEMANENEPMKLDTLKTNLVLTYFYKLKGSEYKLYWIMAETNDDVESYFTEIETAENNNETLASNSKYVAEVSDFYDYSKLKALPDSDINKIYNNNANSIVILNTYYDKSIINTGVGFFISDGIIVTTWNFVEESLMHGQFILIRDKDGKLYEYDGFVTATPELDIAVIKLKEKVSGKVSLGDVSTMAKEDPVIAISTKSGIGLSVVSGIMISNEATIKSLIPLSSTDEGSPLFNSKGEVIGINTSKSVNSSISIAMPTTYLTKLQQQFLQTDFANIKTITFDELKEKYYYSNYNKETLINSIGSKTWNKYKKIGDIENKILINLVKASYYDGVISLRYQNQVSNLISNMSMASSFRGQLIDDGYKKTYESTTKCVYESSKYKVIIMDEFNYLIVLMVKK